MSRICTFFKQNKKNRKKQTDVKDELRKLRIGPTKTHTLISTMVT